MFKFVLCALLAAAIAEPEPEPKPDTLIASYAYGAPYGYSSTYLTPGATTITKTASSYIANPYLYSASPYFSHFIKKRSAPFYGGSYYAPNLAYSAYSSPLVSGYSSPLVYSSPLLSSSLAYSAPAHFIKKRSTAALLPSTYIAPTTYASGPLLASSYAYGSPFLSSAPLYSSPFGYSHFIKKRSAQLLPYSAGYIAPGAASYSYSASGPLLTSTYGAAPIVSASPYYSYSSPLGFIKK